MLKLFGLQMNGCKNQVFAGNRLSDQRPVAIKQVSPKWILFGISVDSSFLVAFHKMYLNGRKQWYI